MLAVFQRMTQGVLTVMGEDSFLRGSEPCRCNIEHGVQVIGSEHDVVVERSVATIAASLAPKVGDSLTHPDGEFRLDALFTDNGTLRRYILLKVN